MPFPSVLLFLILATSTFAGCFDGGAHLPVDDEDVPSSRGRTFGTAVALPQNADHGAEPSVAVLSDGTIFVAAMSGSAWKTGVPEGSAWLWRSQDEGASWERLRGPYPDAAGDAPFAPPNLLTYNFCSCDTDVVTSPDGWVYYTDWWVVHDAVGNFIVERSSDGGATWHATPVTIPSHGAFGPNYVDRQWLLAGEDGFVALFYHEADAVASQTDRPTDTIKVVMSHDHGATWNLPVTVNADPGIARAAHPRLHPDGSLIVPLVDLTTWDASGAPGDAPAMLRVARSTDQGATWETHDVVAIPEGVGALFPLGAAIDAEGRILMAYNANSPGGVHLFTTESTDGGQTWSDPAPLATEGFNGVPWVTADEGGRVAVAWYHNDWTGSAETAPADTEWYLMTAERTAAGEVWAMARADPTPVHLGPHGFGGDTSSAPRPLRDYLSLEYAPDGSLDIAYTRSFTEDYLGLGRFPATFGQVHHVRAEAAP